MTLQKKFFTSKQATATAFAIGLILAVSGSVFATSIGTDLSVSGTATITGVSTHTGLSTFTGAFVSQASSTVVGAYTVTGLSTLGNTVSGTGGFISAASSTVVGRFSVGGDAVISIGSSTPAKLFNVAGDMLINSTSTTATTTVTIASGAPSGTAIGGCINLRATDGTMIRIYATTSPLTGNATHGYVNAGQGRGYENLVVEAGSCQ